TVPAVLNLTLANADQQLKAAELKSKVERVDSDKPADTVIDVNPPAGTTVAKGFEVTLKVSKGNLKAVPDVSGKGYTAETATAVLKQAGFGDVKVVSEDTNNPAENGKVLRQSPAAGSVKDPATTITIQVGDYNAPVTTPPTPNPSSS